MNGKRMKTILVDAVYTFVDEQGNIDESLHQLLETYPNRKIILTNADYETENKYHLNEMPYEVFTLKHDPKKSDPAYFRRMLTHFGLAPEDVVYFEHGADACASARSVGILTYQYDPAAHDLLELKAFLDEKLRE